MAYSPKERRDVLTLLRALRDVHRPPEALRLASEQSGIAESTIRLWRMQEKASPTPAHSPLASYSPFITEPQERKVELSRSITTEVFLSDVHFHPESRQGHDEAAWAVTEEALKDLQPDILFFGGDICDLYAPSRYDKIPRLATPEAFDGEVQYCRKKLEEIRELCPNSRMIWLTGNHELRLPRSVMSNAPWLYNAIQDVEKLLELYRYDIQFVEDGYQVGKLRHYHGHNNPGAGRVNIAKQKFERLLTSFVFGHHHKFSKWIQRDQDGSYYGAFGNGCIQWLSTDYAPNPDWTQGFSVIQYTKAGSFHVDQVLIHKPSVWSRKAEIIYNGKQYKIDLEHNG